MVIANQDAALITLPINVQEKLALKVKPGVVFLTAVLKMLSYLYRVNLEKFRQEPAYLSEEVLKMFDTQQKA
jgi:hypothetical protein